MKNFTTILYNWYHQNKRQLPWRQTRDPYKIWLSEIILQQTRVTQGISYYTRFTEQFQTIKTLAAADEDEVLKLWQGLGYYSRARNLHQTAQTIVKKYDGIFPDNYPQILELKGIGPYTAAAISSISFSLPYPAVDGNVYRVLSRYFNIDTPIDSTKGKKDFQTLAEELLDHNNPGLHNQALMEFGALQCVPKSPDCPNCPMLSFCLAANKRKVDQLPVKEKKTRQRNRYFYFYLIEQKNFIYLEKRTKNDIWKNLYQLPLVETDYELNEDEILKQQPVFLQNKKAIFISFSEKKKHILSHQIIWARVIRIEITNNTHINTSLMQVNKKDISKFAVPRLLELFFDELNL